MPQYYSRAFLRAVTRWRPNIALSTPLLIQLLLKVEERIVQVEDEEERHDWIVFLHT